MTAAIDMSPQRRLAITVVMMASTFIQVLDSTIANVALPHMQATLGAAPDQVTWILTSYIIASAVATPLTGWFEARIGRFALLIASISGFTIASMLCGVATSLQMMVISRLLQGAFGAFLGPLSQAVLLDIYPSEQRARAITIWSMGVMVGPIVGPLVGGWLTDNYNWRWVFFINVPVGALTLLGAIALIPRRRIPSEPFDMVGFGLLALMLCALQLMLDRGTDQDWFNSVEIIIEAGVAAGALWMFVIHTMTAKKPLLPMALFTDRNFMLANGFLLVVYGVLISGAALIPPMVQLLLGYDTLDAGLMIVPRGVSMMLAMMFVGRLVGKVDARLLIFAGMVCVYVALWMMTGFSLGMDQKPLIISGLIQGFGLGFLFIPLNLVAFSTLPPHVRTSGAAMWNLFRNVGGSIAIALYSALLSYNIQVSHSDLVTHVDTQHVPIADAGLFERIGISTQLALKMMDAEVNRQAMMIAYLDDFWLMAWMTLLMMPLVFFLNPMKKVRTEEADMPMLE